MDMYDVPSHAYACKRIGVSFTKKECSGCISTVSKSETCL